MECSRGLHQIISLSKKEGRVCRDGAALLPYICLKCQKMYSNSLWGIFFGGETGSPPHASHAKERKGIVVVLSRTNSRGGNLAALHFLETAFPKTVPSLDATILLLFLLLPLWIFPTLNFASQYRLEENLRKCGIPSSDAGLWHIWPFLSVRASKRADTCNGFLQILMEIQREKLVCIHLSHSATGQLRNRRHLCILTHKNIRKI